MPSLDIDPAVLGNWSPNWPAPVRSGPLLGPSPTVTRPFWELYDNVTDMIRNCYRSLHSNSGTLQFFEYLIAGFFAAYRGWPNDPDVLNYLVLFNRRSPYRVLQLVGQAYLHMAYDLPRTIADALTTDPAIPITRTEAKMAYLSLEPGFVTVSEETFRKRSRIGVFAAIGFLGFSRRSAAGHFSYWVKAIRSNAFHHAEILIDPPSPYTRAVLERRLFLFVNQAAMVVLQRSSNPLLWLPGLTSPSLMILVLVLGFKPLVVASLVAVIIVATWFYFFLVYRGLLQLIEELGVAVNAAAWNAVGILRPHEGREEKGR
jgi:hypothetical protein